MALHHKESQTITTTKIQIDFEKIFYCVNERKA